MILAEWGVDASHPGLGPALPILGELVTNSVRHAAVTCSSLTVTFAAGKHTLAFGVHDRHPYHPWALPGAGGLAAIVEVMDWSGGTSVIRRDTDGGGKTVWNTLPL